jgi:gamma-glutamylaminecyclotransferase
MKNRSTTLVFVYGSLKAGFHNHRVLKNSEFLGNYRTQNKYEMVSFGSFPAVLKNSPKHYITGELYSVDGDVFDDLDTLEGEGYLYKRELIRLKGSTDKVWMYFYIAVEDDWDMENVQLRGDSASWG